MISAKNNFHFPELDMDKIIEGIFAVDKDHKQKLVLIQTLKPHLLKVDVAAGHKIISLCLDRLSDNTIVAARSLSSHTLTIMFQVRY